MKWFKLSILSQKHQRFVITQRKLKILLDSICEPTMQDMTSQQWHMWEFDWMYCPPPQGINGFY
jgi:hypothetical protein